MGDRDTERQEGRIEKKVVGGLRQSPKEAITLLVFIGLPPFEPYKCL